MMNDNCHTFKQNQIFFCIHSSIVKDGIPVDIGEDRLRERGSLPATFYVLTRVIFSMSNDNCRTFKRNQIILWIPSSIIDSSRSVDFVEDQLRERGSLPATFYVLTRVIFSMTNDNCRTFKQNQIILWIPSSIIDSSRSVDFVDDQLRERGSLPATFYVLTRVFSMANDNSCKFKQNQIIFCI